MNVEDRTIREGDCTVAVASSIGDTLRDAATSAPPDSSNGRAGSWLPAVLSDRYDVVERLPARGAEADLHIVKDRDGKRLVVKAYRYGFAPKENVLRRLRSADSPHLVQLVEYGEEDGVWWELQEFVKGSSLRERIAHADAPVTPWTVRKILQQLNDALITLHELQLEHRDLKPDNVLVRSWDPFLLALADFGIASVMEVSVRFTATARTIGYAPPEALGTLVSEEGTANRSVVTIVRNRWDYWSLGMMLIELLSGRHPFDGLSDAAISHRLATQDVEALVEEITDGGWKKLCRGLLRRDPEKRWTGEEVSRWLRHPDDESLEVEKEEPPHDEAQSIFFDGIRYSAPEQLGLALSGDWEKAVSFWKRRFQDLHTWVTDVHGDWAMGNDLLTLERSAELTLDAQVFSFIHLLAPGAPLRFRDFELTSGNIESLGERVLGKVHDPEAEKLLLSLHEGDICKLSAGLEQGQAFASLAKDWDKAVAEFELTLSSLERNGVRVSDNSERLLARILAAKANPKSNLAEFVRDANKACTSDALACEWFRELANRRRSSSAAALFLLPKLRRQAEEGARQRRKRLRETAAARARRNWRIFGQCILASIVGALTGALGFVIGWITGLFPGSIILGVVSILADGEIWAMRQTIWGVWTYMCAGVGFLVGFGTMAVQE